jgi:hypothetical protein
MRTLQKIRFFTGIAALALVAGCVLFPGSIEEGLPKLRDKLPETTRVYLPSPLNPNGGFLYTRNAQVVAGEFKAAFEKRGISVAMPDKRSKETQTLDIMAQAKTNKCDVVLVTQILEWNYGDTGFTGFGGRDEVTLSTMLLDPVLERVLTRATIRVYNGIGRSPPGGSDNPNEAIAPIIEKYVNSLFPEKKDE